MVMGVYLLLANFLSSKYGSADSNNCSRSAGSTDWAGSSASTKEGSSIGTESAFDSIVLALWRLIIFG